MIHRAGNSGIRTENRGPREIGDTVGEVGSEYNGNGDMVKDTGDGERRMI